MSNYNYVPILKGKGGELASLGELQNNIKDLFTPVIELIQSKKEVKQITKVADQMKSNWENREFFIDVYVASGDNHNDESAILLKKFLELNRKRNLKFIPVNGLGRINSYNNIVKDSVNSDKMGMCLRLLPKDITKTNFEILIKDLLSFYGVSPSDVHLLIDLGAIPGNQIDIYSLTLKAIFQKIPSLEHWKSFILSASTFPISMGALKEPVNKHQRGEWIIWKSLHSIKKEIKIIPSFGDYGITNPFLMEEYDPVKMSSSAKIKYTCEDYWFILKGKNLKQYGYEQFPKICKYLIKQTEFKGKDYSAGDSYILKCAEGEVGNGNQTTWVRVGTTHHLTLVSQQVASTIGS